MTRSTSLMRSGGACLSTFIARNPPDMYGARRAVAVVGEGRNEVVVLGRIGLQPAPPEVVPGITEAVDFDRHLAGDEIVARDGVALQCVRREQAAGPQVR